MSLGTRPSFLHFQHSVVGRRVTLSHPTGPSNVSHSQPCGGYRSTTTPGTPSTPSTWRVPLCTCSLGDGHWGCPNIPRVTCVGIYRQDVLQSSNSPFMTVLVTLQRPHLLLVLYPHNVLPSTRHTWSDSRVSQTHSRHSYTYVPSTQVLWHLSSEDVVVPVPSFTIRLSGPTTPLPPPPSATRSPLRRRRQSNGNTNWKGVRHQRVLSATRVYLIHTRTNT